MVRGRANPRRRVVAQGRVWPLGVVVDRPCRDQLASRGQVAEQGILQELAPHPTVEAFDREQVNATGPREPATRSARVCPVRCGAIRSCSRRNPSGSRSRSVPYHRPRLSFRACRQTCPRDVIQHIRRPEPPPVTARRHCRSDQWRSDGNSGDGHRGRTALPVRPCLRRHRLRPLGRRRCMDRC